MSELKPCPFCGGEAELKKYYPPFNRRAMVTVKCTSCRCDSGEWRRSDKAIEAWNTRADAEIRAKAIDEFAEKVSMYGTYDYHGNVINIFEIAEQMKGGVSD